MVSAIFALCTRQIVLGCLIFAYAQMQLSEALIWSGIDTNNTELNKTGTSFGKYLLATHNIAIGVGILLSLVFISRRPITSVDFIPLAIGIMFFLFVVLYYYIPDKTSAVVTYPNNATSEGSGTTKDGVCDKRCQNPENRLNWPYPHGWYLLSFLISIIICAIWIKPMNSKIVLLIFFGLSLIVTSLIYPNTVGSMWCWSTSFLAPAVVLISYMLIRNEPSSDLLI